MQPFVPLFPAMGLSVALLSYDGRLFWGFTADYDAVPDVGRFRDDVRQALEDLDRAARRRRSRAARA